MRNYIHFIRRLPFFQSFGVLAILLACLYLLFWVVHYKLFGGCYDLVFVENPNQEQSREMLIFGAIIVAPLIETLISQMGVYYLLKQFRWFQKHEFRIALAGGVIFGLLHFFSLVYIAVETFIGIFFMYAYIIKLHKNGYWMVVLLHAFVNALALSLECFE